MRKLIFNLVFIVTVAVCTWFGFVESWFHAITGFILGIWMGFTLAIVFCQVKSYIFK